MKRLAVISAAVLFGCATTQLTHSWKNPEFKGQMEFKKIVVMAISQEETTRRVAEDQLVKFIGPDRAIPSYTLLELKTPADMEGAQAKFKKAGADGLVTVRPLDVRKEVNYVPGTVSGPYYSPWVYSSASWGRTYEPGYMATDTILRLETNIYSLGDEKLIWSGTSETFNPQRIETEINDLARAVQARLKAEKLIP